ncbi:MAG: hypothetical protein AABZ78_06825 [Chloroflexota bacterium]
MNHDAIEVAREFGIDIEQLRAFRKLTPTQRLERLQEAANRALPLFKSVEDPKEYIEEFSIDDFMIEPLTLEDLIKLKEASSYPIAKRQLNILRMLQKTVC